eukprot:362057-Chlamydomonas_euryale.AAC.13
MASFNQMTPELRQGRDALAARKPARAVSVAFAVGARTIEDRSKFSLVPLRHAGMPAPPPTARHRNISLLICPHHPHRQLPTRGLLRGRRVTDVTTSGITPYLCSTRPVEGDY